MSIYGKMKIEKKFNSVENEFSGNDNKNAAAIATGDVVYPTTPVDAGK